MPPWMGGKNPLLTQSYLPVPCVLPTMAMLYMYQSRFLVTIGTCQRTKSLNKKTVPTWKLVPKIHMIMDSFTLQLA
jgi:predicted ATP-binding protein involved in virulence